MQMSKNDVRGDAIYVAVKFWVIYEKKWKFQNNHRPFNLFYGINVIIR